MSTPRLSATVFHRQFLRFKEQVLMESGEPFRSFNEGGPYRWEAYKAEIYREGRNRLGCHAWTTRAIGSGDILRSVIKAVEINVTRPTGGRLRNNLVAWTGRFGDKSKTHRSLQEALNTPERRRAYEKLLFDFYRNRIDPDAAFESLVEFGGRRYDFIAYLFFLKDWTRYMPIASSVFEQAFELLELNFKTAHQCSWDNFRAFNAVLQQVRDALRDEGLEDVPLIDAHSFCWMLARLPAPRQARRAVQIPIAEECNVRSAGRLLGSAGARSGSRGPVDWQRLQQERSAVGRQAEELVRDSERKRLRAAGCPDLAARVEIVSDDHTLGYDVRSFNADGSDRHIEVKAVRDNDESFLVYVTENELQQSRTLRSFYFYFVFGTRETRPRIRAIRAERLRREFLSPVLHVANLALV
jgi:hypothetical protein